MAESRIARSILVGGTLPDAARRVASAWKRASRGEKIAARDTITFVSWSALASVMSDRRHELLRFLFRNPTPSVRALARALGRDYKRVHADVRALSAVGLVAFDGKMLRAEHGQIRTVIDIQGAAA